MEELSGWRAVLVERMRMEAQPPEKLSHQPRLVRLTEQIGEGLQYDREVLFAAAWIHDLGVFQGHRPEEIEALRTWNSTAYTVAHAPALLEGCGFPAEKIAAVVECIRTHEARERPQTVEGMILRDADILEQLGAVGATRTVCKIGRDTRFRDFREAAVVLRKALMRLPAELHYEAAKRLAEPRVEILRQFLEALESESGGVL